MPSPLAYEGVPDGVRPTGADLLTPQQLAGLCQVPITTVYAWNYKGSGPSYLKVGRHVRYLRSEVDRWLVKQASVSRRNL